MILNNKNVKNKKIMNNYSTNVTSDAVDAMYDSTKQNGNYTPKNTFDANNYLDTSLPKGETSRKVTIRILPISATDNRPFVEIRTHSMHVPEEVSKSKFKSYVCLSSPNLDIEGEKEKCPLCAKGNRYYALSKAEESVEAKRKFYLAEANNPSNYEGLSEIEAEELKDYYLGKAEELPNEADKKAYMDKAKSYFSKKTYIARVIERGKESQGPKFWRFNARNDEGDPYSQIKEIYTTRKAEAIEDGLENYNIFDLNEGKDLILRITPALSGRGVAINVTDAGRKSPLSPDVETANSWINDSKVWKNMYGIKNANYLSIIAENQVPVWDKSLGKYVAKASADEEDSKSDDTVKNTVTNESVNNAAQKIVEPTIPMQGEEDDLPF